MFKVNACLYTNKEISKFVIYNIKCLLLTLMQKKKDFWILYIWTDTVFTTQPPTCPDTINVSLVSRNFSLEELQEIILSLKVNKSNTSGYRRSLTCAYDPRPSSFAIGTLGISLICGMIAVLIIADCTTVMKTCKHMKRKKSIVEWEKRERKRERKKKKDISWSCHSIFKTTSNYFDILFFFKMYVMFIHMP